MNSEYRVRDLNRDDCSRWLMQYIKDHQLERVFGLHTHADPTKGLGSREETFLGPLLDALTKLPKEFPQVYREQLPAILPLALYDFSILIDNSLSMEYGGRTYDDLKQDLGRFLHLMKTIYTKATQSTKRVIHASFFNGNDDMDLLDEGAINTLLEQYEFQGLTRIGTSLMNKVLRPQFFDLHEDAVILSDMNRPYTRVGDSRQLRVQGKLKRPLFVMIVTCGTAEGEPRERLAGVIKSALEAAEAGGLGPRAVVFQIVLIGDHDQTPSQFERFHFWSNPVTVPVFEVGELLTVWERIEETSSHNAGFRKHINERDQWRALQLLLGPIYSSMDPDLATALDYLDMCPDDFDDDAEDEFEIWNEMH